MFINWGLTELQSMHLYTDAHLPMFLIQDLIRYTINLYVYAKKMLSKKGDCCVALNDLTENLH